MSADPVFVKICGLRDVDAARVAIEAGADALGFILAPSKRQISPAVVRGIRDEIERDGAALPRFVGVVVNLGPAEIRDVVSESGIDMIQLSGDEEPDILQEIETPVIKALRFSAGTRVDEALREVERWVGAPSPPRYVLVDGHEVGSYGGTGTRADWDLVAEVARRFPVVMAGGLDPENVVEAIDRVRPFGVDVSSGTETDGAKDPVKIRNFVCRAKTRSAPGRS